MNIQKINTNIAFNALWINDENKDQIKKLFPKTQAITYHNYKHIHDFLSDEERIEIDKLISEKGGNRSLLLLPKEIKQLNKIKKVINQKFEQHVKTNNAMIILENEETFRKIAKEEKLINKIKKLIKNAIELPQKELGKSVIELEECSRKITTDLLKKGVKLK